MKERGERECGKWEGGERLQKVKLHAEEVSTESKVGAIWAKSKQKGAKAWNKNTDNFGDRLLD